MKYIGVCYDSGVWGGDLTGLLVAEEDGGFAVAATHISSDESWAARDIEYHYDKRELMEPDDTYEWVGQLSVSELEERFGWDGQA